MAHAFDHGLAKPLRTLVRDGVVAALQPLLVSSGGYLLAVEALSSQVRSDDDETMGRIHEVLSGRSPAVLVALGGKEYTEAGNLQHRWSADLTVQVIVFSNHARSLEARLAGDVVSAASDLADPGIDVVLEHVEQLLIGNNLVIGSKAHTLLPQREEEISTDDGQSVWAQTYAIKVSRDVLDSRVALTRIGEFLTTWRGALVVTDTPAQLGSELTDVTP